MRHRLPAILLVGAAVVVGLVSMKESHRAAGPVSGERQNSASGSSGNRDIGVGRVDAQEVLADAEPEPEAMPAVQPVPKPASIASVEEPPSGPEAGESGSGLAPVTVLENMRAAIRQYQARFRENPVGDNAEISRALNGANARKAIFIQAEDGLQLNARGELIDNWGTPYFFHQLSRTQMEIRSAGPDRRMWTSDDLAMK